MLVHLDQIRAANAFARASEAREGAEREPFLRIARKLPAMLQTNGVLASWAFLAKGRAGDGRELVSKALKSHLTTPSLELSAAGKKLQALMAGGGPPDALSHRDLRHLTAELITYAAWLKRAAEAVCDEKQGAPGGSS